MNYKTMIVDGPFLAHRSHRAPYRLTTNTGLDATMIHGFIRALNARRKQFEPERIIIAWESHGTVSWRKRIYPNYKSTRMLTGKFVSTLNDLKMLLYLFGVEQYYSPENEADDVIANFVMSDIEKPVLIFTSDKDLMQLADKDCHVFDGKEIFTIDKVKEKFGVHPRYLPDYLSLVGDSVDNIEGIKGIGHKKAIEIINSGDYGDLDKDKIELNVKLTTLNFMCRLLPYNINKVVLDETIESLLDKYKLESLKKNIDEYKLMGDRK